MPSKLHLIMMSIGLVACSVTGCVMSEDPEATWSDTENESEDVKEDALIEDMDLPADPVEKTYKGNLGSQHGGTVASGTTVGLSSSFTPSCAYSASTPDAVYTWTAPFTGIFVFATGFSKFDTVLEVRNTSNQSLGCNDDRGGSLQSSVTVSVGAGQTVQVIIDGYGSGTGEYRLQIMHVAPWPSGWTGWIDRDGPGGLGDYETLIDLVNEGRTCANPVGIECQTTSGAPWNTTGEVYTCKGLEGGYCINANQSDGSCLDYRVRFNCPGTTGSYVCGNGVCEAQVGEWCGCVDCQLDPYCL